VPTRIALEEHFVADRPAQIERWVSLLPASIRPDFVDQIRATLTDVGSRRLEAMDAAGIALAVLSSVASVQGSGLASAEALRIARESNEHLADIVRERPSRYAGFAAIPLQDPEAGAHELERSVRELGLCGAMILGHTDGRYLDDAIFDVFWERAEALGAPVYLHASDSRSQPTSYAGRPELLGATWSWTAETATHAMRIVLGGVFTRFPDAQLVLGHMGETLPYLLWRIDAQRRRAGDDGPPPSEVFRRNVSVTTAGLCADAPLLCALAELGDDRVMFSVDYPFEDATAAARWIDAAPLDPHTRERVEHGNAEALLWPAAQVSSGATST
jgi:2,3-dihydroxybenzoate decarboxylase